MIYNDETARKVAEYLLKIKAIKIQPEQPFTWASGWKSPIYCDNRVALSYPETRSFLKESFVKLIQEKYPDAGLVAGVATGAIAMGALVADALALPFVYVRPEPKKHGMGKQVEGDAPHGAKTVVLEDLISTGKSSLAVLEPLREAGCHLQGAVATFTYGFNLSEDNFRNAGCPLTTLCDYEHLMQAALALNYIRNAHLESLQAWRKNPGEWGVAAKTS